jgi:hypothetical protein
MVFKRVRGREQITNLSTYFINLLRFFFRNLASFLTAWKRDWEAEKQHPLDAPAMFFVSTFLTLVLGALGVRKYGGVGLKNKNKKK